jgi:glycosyltransferase involved in cell wall biosynthesis
VEKDLKLSVVMATYNREETLRETIRCLDAQDLDPDTYEVIIIDDASPDGTRQVVAEARGKVRFSLKFMANETNQGPGLTENRGIREARSPIVLLMADDIWMEPQALRKHLETHERHPQEEVAVMGRVLQSPKLNQSAFLRHWDPFRFQDIDTEVVELPYYRFWANNISVKRNLFVEHGAFRDEKGRGGAAAHEDSELGYRLHKSAGLRILYQPAATGYHYHLVTLQGAEQRWYQRGLNWGQFHAHVPEPEVPVAYHVLNWSTLRDHLRAIFGPRRRYLAASDRNVVALLAKHFIRLLVFNGLTARFIWGPLLRGAETSPALERLVNRHIYRLYLYYYFLKGVRDAHHLYRGSGTPALSRGSHA